MTPILAWYYDLDRPELANYVYSSIAPPPINIIISELNMSSLLTIKECMPEYSTVSASVHSVYPIHH